MRNWLWPVVMCALLFLCASFRPVKLNSSQLYIVIDKKKYELSVFDNNGWMVTYPVVFGNSDLRDKLIAGDKKTPEGTYTIIQKRVHPKWDRFMMLDYPTKEDYAKFNERKRQGLIPANAQIGSGIGIHGTWPHEDFQIDRFRNWTDGCISMRNKDVEELYNMISVGTKVLIRMN